MYCHIALLGLIGISSGGSTDPELPSDQKIAAATATLLRTHSHERPRHRISDTADLPYFPGREGELCRRKLVEDWEDLVKPVGDVHVGEATLNYEALQDVMKSDRFKVARSLCQPEIELYNRAAAIVCSLESSEENNHDLTYTEAWGGSAQYMDGEYDLATMFVYTDKFRDVGATSTCLADCQIGGDGCKELEMWLPHFGDTSAEQYCSLKWYGIDNAYGDLKICAAKAIGESNLLTKDEYVDAFTASHLSQLNCAYDYCHGESDVEGEVFMTSDGQEGVTVAADMEGGLMRAAHPI